MAEKPQDQKPDLDPETGVNAPLTGASVDPDDLDDGDISRAHLGGAGRWQFRAMNASVVAEEHATQKKASDAESEEARELRHLEEWNRQMTVIGGVSMTNAEAQSARRWMIDHEDDCVRDALKRGQISAEDAEDYRRGLHRSYELADKEGRGTITEAERAERDAWRTSHLGKIEEETIAGYVEQRRAALTGPKAETFFPSAPDVGAAFAAKAQPPQQTALPAMAQSAPERPKPSALDL